MKIAVVYVYAGSMNPKYDEYAYRFLQSYNQHHPGIEHDSIVVLNGVRASSEITCMFSPMMNCGFLEHDNSGYDIGAFQHAAREIPCDMMVFFGASTYFQRTGWLIRMATAFKKHGNAQYGAMGNKGNLQVSVWPHLRTTAFWMDPKLLNAYPSKVTRADQRHPFEHGKDCFTNWVTNQGLRSWVVTWPNELLWKDWDSDPNGYSRGNQSNLLAGDRMCEPPYYPRR